MIDETRLDDVALGVYIVVYCDALGATSGIFQSDAKGGFTHHIAFKRLEIGFNIYQGVHDQNLYQKLPGHKIN